MTDEPLAKKNQTPLVIVCEIALILLALGLWGNYSYKQYQISQQKPKVTGLSPRASTLTIDDPSQFAAVAREPRWYDDNHWHVYVPEGTFQLCLADRGEELNSMTAEDVLPIEPKRVTLPSGKHFIKLEREQLPTGWRVRVLFNRKEVLAFDEKPDWLAIDQPEIMIAKIGKPSKQAPANRPLIIYRNQFGQSKDPRAFYGIHLWIEPTAR
jgi:hypothetical protein